MKTRKLMIICLVAGIFFAIQSTASAYLRYPETGSEFPLSIKTSRTAASFGAEEYEYSLNNQNGILTVDFNTVDFDQTMTNGVITAYDPDEPTGPNGPNIPSEPNNPGDPNYPEPISTYWQEQEDKRAQNLKNCPMVVTKDAPSGIKHPATGLTNPYSKTGRIAPLGSLVEIPPDTVINNNTIWDSDVHLNGKVYVENALLIIMPSITVWNSAEGGIIVRNGGVIHAKGVPGNRIVFISDAQASWTDYDFAIKIEETASPACKMSYCDIVYATKGIWILNNRLDVPIEDNEVWDCNDGIVEEGPMLTDVINNQIIDSWDDGIEVSLADSNGVATSDAEIFIENNLINGNQYCGITVWGVADANDAGKVVMANNLIVGSYWYAVFQGGGWMEAYRICNGYYANYAIENPDNPFDDIDPVILTQDPFVYGMFQYPFFIVQDCNLVDAGCQYIEQTHLIGKTTDVNSLPDSNYTDIGSHYPNWNFSNPGSGDSLSADLDDSMKVDFKDFAIFANYWQQSTTGEADLDGSGFVDYNDLAILTGQWLQVADPNIEIHIYGDSNDGYVDVGVSGFTRNTQRVFLLVDGQHIGEIFWFKDGETLQLDISALGSGVHQLKAVSTNTAGRITCSNLKESTFNCFLNYCFCPDAYDSNEPHYFCAYYSGPNDVSVKVYNEENNLVWSQAYPGESLNGFIPAEITLADDLDSIVFEETSAGGAGAAAAGTSVKKPLGLKFKPKKVPANIRALIIVPSWVMRWITDYGVIQAVKGAFETRGVPYDYLKGSQASYKVLAWYGGNRNIDYIYYCDHGGYKHDNVLRSTISLSDGWAVSVKQSDFAPGQAPSWCEKLPGGLETTANSIYRIGFDQGELEFVHFDCCYTGHLKLTGDNRLVEGSPGQQGLFDIPHSDMSWALKMKSGVTQIFQGWWGEVPKGSLSNFNKFAYHEWTKLKEGAHLYDALMYAIDKTPWEPDGPHDTYRLKGQGDLTDLRIE